MAELLRDDSATLNFSVGVLLVIGGKDTPEIQLKTVFIEIDGQPMMMMTLHIVRSKSVSSNQNIWSALQMSDARSIH